MIGIIRLRPFGVQAFIFLLVIRFLKEDIRPDFGIMQAAVVFNRCGCNVHVYTADNAGFVTDAVNGVNTLQNVVQRIMNGVFASFKREAFVPHILQRHHLGFDFLLRHFFTRDVHVLPVIRAIGAAVDTIVAQIKRCEQDNPVAVVCVFDLFGERKNTGGDVFVTV